MNMNLDIKQIEAAAKKLAQRVKPYRVFIVLMLFLVLFGVVIARIGSYGAKEPSADQVSEKLTTIKRPILKDETKKKIEELENQNVEVKSLFESARQNPFNE